MTTYEIYRRRKHQANRATGVACDASCLDCADERKPKVKRSSAVEAIRKQVQKELACSSI